MKRLALTLLLIGAALACTEAPDRAPGGTAAPASAPPSAPELAGEVSYEPANPEALPVPTAPPVAQRPASQPATESHEPRYADPLDAARRITPTELKALADAGEVVIVDVRNAVQWQAGRIEGAVHIPYGELFERAAELPREKWVAFYCT